jgi:preprotein translocase subunit Sec61beta
VSVVTATARDLRAASEGSGRTLRSLLIGSGLAAATLGVGLLILLQPLYLHAALDAADSASWLGVSRQEAHILSDRTVNELIVGPGTFAFAGAGTARFYDEAEAGHLRDVRVVLIGFLALVVVLAALAGGQLLAARRQVWAWRAVERAGLALAVALLVAGLFALVAFDAAFELFHRLLFPGGNYSFDPGRQRLVQLYPGAFWQLTAMALGALGVAGAAVAWWVGRRRARSLA